MIVLAEFNALLLTSYWIFSFSQFHYISGERPQCKGEPLDPAKFSGVEDVGFVRDMCVDKIARNFYNNFKYSNDYLCKELANIRTSTCFLIMCRKWKRSDNRHIEVTNLIMKKALTLMKTLLDLISKDTPVDQIAGKVVFEHINDAKRQLVDSGAITENSDIVDHWEDMKKILCKHCAISDNKDLIEVINKFFINLKAQNGMKILNHSIEDDVVKKISLTGIVRLKFNYEKGGDTKAGTAIVKIPSLAPFYYTKRKNKVMYPREAYFYEKLLPRMYEMGKCEPFAPKLYAITETRAMILEDLSAEGYKSELKSEFLDFDHSLIFLNVLAQYHALGYVYLNVQNLHKDDSITRLIGSNQPQLKIRTKKDEFDALCKVVKPLLSGTIFERLLMEENEILAKPPVRNEVDKNHMNVIIHGDLHRNNFLFKYDSSGKVYKAKIIDWQFSREGSPILDLIEFFVNNLHAEIFETHENYLLESYLAAFNDNLSLPSTSRRYTRPELDKDMKFYKYHYYRILSESGKWILNYSEQSRKLHATNLAKWLIYLDGKGFIYL